MWVERGWRRDSKSWPRVPQRQACTPLQGSCASGSNKRNRGPLSRTDLDEFSTVSDSQLPGLLGLEQSHAPEARLWSAEETSSLSAVTPETHCGRIPAGCTLG